jgi:hypothetical protein
MRSISNVDVIDIVWDGPFTMEEVVSRKGDADYGVYQIYGTHLVMGPECLLYIGQANENTFGTRMPAHLEWTNWEAHEVGVYLGRLGGIEPMTSGKQKLWEDRINRAEKLMIYFCAPPYNAANIKSLPQFPPTVVVNYRHRNRLPYLISNISEQSPAEDPRFKAYSV